MTSSRNCTPWARNKRQPTTPMPPKELKQTHSSTKSWLRKLWWTTCRDPVEWQKDEEIRRRSERVGLGQATFHDWWQVGKSHLNFILLGPNSIALKNRLKNRSKIRSKIRSAVQRRRRRRRHLDRFFVRILDRFFKAIELGPRVSPTQLKGQKESCQS